MAERAAVLARVLRAAAGELVGLTDRELLRRFVDAADQAAFAVLVNRHAAMVLGVARRVLHSQADAEDTCQAVFLILSRKARTNHWQVSVANWLYATARRVAHTARRTASRRPAGKGWRPFRKPCRRRTR
ncbi:RNA polymerase sigma factor [Fimbriiglobus ruber]|uniref:High-affnity carbon uptake protein Hat/HatR n=1 Tax=Fimbriiglobus ruber TaxID=1908690 RepID=A0A225DA46_9BACT|nr:sigma factor [Fimbriiglobus ruber]OWK38470.1 High-affnity carbon uptake protein Hat/HatR [Fimbriiglobus ruber]